MQRWSEWVGGKIQSINASKKQTTTTTMKTFTAAEVARHNTETDLWIIIDGNVYDVTKFVSEHPGGKKVLVKVAGQDASKQFHQFHQMSVLAKFGGELCVGEVGSGGEATAASVKSTSTTVTTTTKLSKTNIVTSKISNGMKSEMFGEGLPFGDPGWYQGLASPFYNESHRRLRAWIRAFVDDELMAHAHEWDESGEPVPRSVFERCGAAGILTAVCGPPWPSMFVPQICPPAGIKPEEFDAFHEFIIMDELARVGSGGVLWGLLGGHTIALPPIIHFASDRLKERVVPDCLAGKKVVCLAITEPSAGSDVANIKTEATKTPDGSHYIVNGEKKWITNGIFADYFVVAVRTGGPGMAGISLLLLERGMPGITTRKMKCSGVWSSGTTYITFEDVRVPIDNLIGHENKGFKAIMFNFNHERLGIAIQANRFARVCLEESIKYALKRETFGQKLMEHAVIRNKIAHMSRRVEATHAWIESMVYQVQMLDKSNAQDRLGGATALLKAQATQTFEFCAREAAQIFGGLSFTRGGQGEKVERLYREVRAYAIPGGSEEIMLDLGVRQSLKVAQAMMKSKI